AKDTRTTDTNVQPWWGAAQWAWGNSIETGPDPVTGKPLIGSYGLNGWLYNGGGQLDALGGAGSGAHAYSVPVQRQESQIPAFADCIWRHVLPFPSDAAGANLTDPGPQTLAAPQPMSKVVINRHDRAINVSFLDG